MLTGGNINNINDFAIITVSSNVLSHSQNYLYQNWLVNL